jgi:uncharacterized membrane protein YdcZ (DUF606 family)
MNEAKKPSGAAAAALLSAATGTVVLGVMTVAAEANAGFRNALAWVKAAGPLSGKTFVALIAWVVSWIILGTVWRGKDLRLTPILVISAGLLVLGLLFTFPPFFDLFAPK